MTEEEIAKLDRPYLRNTERAEWRTGALNRMAGMKRSQSIDHIKSAASDWEKRRDNLAGWDAMDEFLWLSNMVAMKK